jgi:hypothetical protein
MKRGGVEIFIHPNSLVEAYCVISKIIKEEPKLLTGKIDPKMIIRSAYATLNVVQDERTTVELGELKTTYEDKPLGDLSSAALALALSDEEKIPVVILDEERHFKELKEVVSIRISDLKL